MRFTTEQQAAISRRQGDLLVDAGAGSGKTSVLVERFVSAVREDGVEVSRILAITFTEKAAAELRERIRARLRELGCEAEARETEGAFISTIHGFCAGLLRTHALAAGLDPSFVVLEAQEAAQLAGAAFDAALADAALRPGGAELIATHGPIALRGGILAVHDELRSRGQLRPELPELAAVEGNVLTGARAAAAAAARDVARELAALPDPGVRVSQALDALDRVEELLDGRELWPTDLDSISLPGRNGAAALKTETCDAYRETMDRLRTAVISGYAASTRDALNELLLGFGERYRALKREHSAVDFEDLELLARELLRRPEIGTRYRERFLHLMVDELQDTNRVQLELVDLLSGQGALFMVGDAQQSIYGFRHADVELFEERGRQLAERGARLSLQANFRSRQEILGALNGAFESVWGEGFRALRPGLEVEAADAQPRTEMLIIDKGADWETEGLAAPWRLAEARVLAARVAELISSGTCLAGDVVLLTRATTDLQVYERALEAAGVPTYVIGGRGYWNHRQVVEMVSYLRALANPLDEEAFLTVLVSPLCGLSLDGLVLVAAEAREELSADDRARLERFEAWFGAERAAAPRLGVEQLLERAMGQSGYDAAILAMPAGPRRLANVRKLMRLGREWEAAAGFDLRGFLGLVAQRAWGGSNGGGATGAGRESEAPVESEGLDAVRLMTIHRAKGLEFPIVCVADLGRGPIYRGELIRIGRDGKRLGLRLGRPGTGARVLALDYIALGDEEAEAERAEERRLFYVAMTRAQERLILSGAADLEGRPNRSPIGWIAPAFGADLTQPADPSFTTDLGARIRFISEVGAGGVSGHYGQKLPQRSPGPAPPPAPPPAPAPPPPPAPARVVPSSAHVTSVSYSSLALHERCGYRFYVERVLGLPPKPEPTPRGPTQNKLPATDRGTLVHEALRAIDLRRPQPPSDVPGEIRPLIEAFIASDTRTRLGNATDVRREQPFAFAQGQALITGTFDALATEPDGTTLVVDYKTDRLPAAHDYDAQRLIYALAALKAGAERVDVVHLFLEDTSRPVSHSFDRKHIPELQTELQRRATPLIHGRFEVTQVPQRSICAGCPALGGLCSWPAETAMRPAADRLF